MLCFGYLCTNVFVLCFMSIVLGGGLPACGGVGAPLLLFLRVVSLRGAVSAIYI